MTKQPVWALLVLFLGACSASSSTPAPGSGGRGGGAATGGRNGSGGMGAMGASGGAATGAGGDGGGDPGSTGGGTADAGTDRTASDGSPTDGGAGAAGGTLATGGAGAGGGQGGLGGGGTTATGGDGGVAPAKDLRQLQRDFVDLRFGMFLHFGILTFCGSQPGDPCPGAWSQPNLAISNFRPSTLYDPGQWADAAASANMKYGVLTTRHHDGFALWPSAASTFNVKSIPWKDGKGDVVRDYVDAFRKRGLQPGLYYSVWDTTQGVDNNGVTPAELAYVKTQLTELLTNYGPIPILVIDGWSWKTGHQAVAYQEIRELVKSLQPNCLLTDHTHLQDPWEVDIVNFEEPTGAFSPPTNSYAAQQGMKINATGGNDWFWAPNYGGLMTVTSIVDGHLKQLEPRWTTFLLNCPPNRDGLLDAATVRRLGEVGAAWSPNPLRPPLPVQGRVIEHPYTPLSATATSGTAANAIDGLNNRTVHTSWQTAGAFPQSITLDLGQVRPDVGLLDYLPAYPLVPGLPGLTAGAVTSYGIMVSTNGTTFTEVAAGTWAADGKLKKAAFTAVPARYVRFEVRGANGTTASTTELTVGANR